MKHTFMAAVACLLLSAGPAFAVVGPPPGGEQHSAAPLPLPAAGALGGAILAGALGMLGAARRRRTPKGE